MSAKCPRFTNRLNNHRLICSQSLGCIFAVQQQKYLVDITRAKTGRQTHQLDRPRPSTLLPCTIAPSSVRPLPVGWSGAVATMPTSLVVTVTGAAPSRLAMTDEIEVGPEALEQALASAIRTNMPLIRQVAGRPKHIPGDEQYRMIARRLVEHLKRSGVEKVVRSRYGSHGIPLPRKG
jgi:hypothetical protein